MQTIQVQLRGRFDNPVFAQALPTSSPHFAIHRPYFSDSPIEKGWKLSHVHSGLGCGDAIYGKNARQILRVLAAVLAAQPVEWGKDTFTAEEFDSIDASVRTWARSLVSCRNIYS